MPVDRSTRSTGPELRNSTATEKLPVTSLPTTAAFKATCVGTALPSATAQSPEPPRSTSPLGSSTTSGARSAEAAHSQRSSWEERMPPARATSPVLLGLTQQPRSTGHRARVSEEDSGSSSAASPAPAAVGKLDTVSQEAGSRTSRSNSSRKADCGTDVPSAAPAAPTTIRRRKGKSPWSASAAVEQSSSTSPPPAKKLVLSARKVSLSSCPGPSAGALCLLKRGLCWQQVQSQGWGSCLAREGGESPSPGCGGRAELLLFHERCRRDGSCLAEDTGQPRQPFLGRAGAGGLRAAFRAQRCSRGSAMGTGASGLETSLLPFFLCAPT